MEKEKQDLSFLHFPVSVVFGGDLESLAACIIAIFIATVGDFFAGTDSLKITKRFDDFFSLILALAQIKFQIFMKGMF